MKKIDINSIKIFEEFKESTDFFVQNWFKTKEDEFKEWFKLDEYSGFTFNEYTWNGGDLYGIFNAQLEFNESKVDYKLDIVIEESAIDENNIINELSLILQAYGEIENRIQKNIKEAQLTSDILLTMISEIKE